MFNLVATVLAVVVMIAVAVAGLSFLGPAFGRAETKAVVAQVLNGSQQIVGAEDLLGADEDGAYAYDASGAPATATLVADGYLRAVPAVPTGVTAPGASWAVTPGVGGLPVVTLELDASRPAAAALCAEVARDVGGPYGCTTDPSTLAAQ